MYWPTWAVLDPDGIYWFPDDPIDRTYTLFAMGWLYDGFALGPIEFTFNRPVKNFSVVLESKKLFRPPFENSYILPLKAGHYMVALDSTGQRIDSMSFDAGVIVSEKTLGVRGIRKVAIYSAINFVDPAFGAVSDEVVYRASFAPDTVPPGKLRCLSAAGDSVVTRGKTVTCTVTGTGVAVTAWTFDGADYKKTDPQAHHIIGPTSGNTWPGIAVTGGTVTAAATVNGVPRSDPLTTSFAVTPRPWHWTKSSNWSYSTKGAPDCSKGTKMTYRENTVMGWTVRKLSCESFPVSPRPLAYPYQGFQVGPVPSGPNKGLWYTTSVSYRMDTQSGLNPDVFSGSKAVWTLVTAEDKQKCGKLTSVNFYNYNLRCRGASVIPFQNGLWLHEGYGKSAGTGHQGRLEIGAVLPTFDLHAVVESVFAGGDSVTRAAVANDADIISRALYLFADPQHNVVKDNWCGFVWMWDIPTTHFVWDRVPDWGVPCI